MLEKTKTDIILGLLVLLASLFVLFVWIPVDVESGIFEKVRRRLEIGDSFAPTIAGIVLLLGSVLLIVEGIRNPGITRLGMHSWVFALSMLLIFLVTFTIMRWAGPVAVNLLAPADLDYRTLRDTVPWKYTGFMLGGTAMVTTLICAMEHRFSWRAIVIGLVAALALIAVYDLPFDDLLLPPNGDV